MMHLEDALDVRIVLLNGLVMLVHYILLDFDLLEGVVNLKADAGD